MSKIIKGKLKSLTGIHMGGGEAGVTVDQTFFRNANGDIVIPGTSIAGVLRNEAIKIAPYFGFDEVCKSIEEKPEGYCNCPVCKMFGSLNFSQSEKNDPNFSSSKLWIYDAPLQNKNEIEMIIRDGVGITRTTGSAAREERSKFNLEIIPRGAVFNFRMEIEEKINKMQEALLSQIMLQWLDGECYIGSGISRGLGKMKLYDMEVYTLDLNDKSNLIKYLKSEEKIIAGKKENDWLEKVNDIHVKQENFKQQKIFKNSYVKFDLVFQFTGEMLTNDDFNASRMGYDFFPKREAGEFVLPGSSIKGAMRTQAERIARTIALNQCKNEKGFIESCPACNPVSQSSDINSLTSCSTLIKHFYSGKDYNEEKKDLCLSCKLFGSTISSGKLNINDAYLMGEPEIKIRDFLAIDRFTGGGKEGAKFDAISLWKPAFNVKITLQNPKEWQLGWLFLLFKDLEDGLYNIGFGSNKGFGEVEIKEGVIEIRSIKNELFSLKINSNRKGIYNTVSFDFHEFDSSTTINNWIDKFNQEVVDFQRSNKEFMEKIEENEIRDIYFADNIYEFYSEEVL